MEESLYILKETSLWHYLSPSLWRQAKQALLLLPSEEGQGETAVFAGYKLYRKIQKRKVTICVADLLGKVRPWILRLIGKAGFRF